MKGKQSSQAFKFFPTRALNKVPKVLFTTSVCDASQEPPKLANGPITRNMAKRIQARLNLWAQKEVTRRIQEQASMLMEEELKESPKFINLLEVIMENGV